MPLFISEFVKVSTAGTMTEDFWKSVYVLWNESFQAEWPGL